MSLKTVSRVVNGEGPVAPATLERVASAIEELGYRRNDLARSLRSKGGSGMIGLVIEDLANPFYSAIAKGIEETATARGFLVIIGSSEEDPAREREIVGALCARQVEGIVVVPAGRRHRYLAPEMEAGLRVVFVDRPPGQIDADTLLLDNRRATTAAITLLNWEGHSRIGLISDALELYSVGERVRGYREALRRCGLVVEPALERIGIHTVASAQDAAASLLRAEHPTALFCTNNRAAIGAVRAVLREQVDVAIVGFDDFELSDLLPIRIRVIRYDATALGRQAADALFRRIDGESSGPRRAVVRSELVWRGLERPAEGRRAAGPLSG